MEVVLIKHGRTDYDDHGKRQGATDLSLNDRGVKEVELLKEELTEKQFDVVFSSPSKQALQTANIMFPDQNIVKNDYLRGYDAGELEGIRYSEPADKFPDNEVVSYNGKEFLVPQEGETLEYIVHRVERFVQLLLHGFGEEASVAVVTHPVIVEIFRALAEGKDWSTYLMEDRYTYRAVEVHL